MGEEERGSMFDRKIEFIPAKKHFNGFNKGFHGFKLETLNPTTTTTNSIITINNNNNIIKNDSGSGIRIGSSVVGFDPDLTFGFTMRRIGAGLENLGNTCFLNSVLQCLTYTEPLAAYLQSGSHKNSCRKTGFCALCAIQNHVSRALQSSGRSLAPKDLVSNLRCISRNFRNARQEDAHEYMVNLLESMHKCCLPSGVPTESPSAFEKSLVHKIFGGQLRSQVKCTQCSFCSDKFDPFLDLSLEINKTDSLLKALQHFTAKEYLDGGAREYQCQKCKQKVKAIKQLSIHKPPCVLNVHLKRFGCHQPGQKIDKKVHFGPTLDLKPFVSGPYEGDLKYTLYGVLVHYGGSTHSGHYYCFVRTSSGMWYSLDDHNVCNVSQNRVFEARAYMLFYVRDRKNVIPKKPVDVGQAQSMILNAMGNRMQSSFTNQVSKKFQDGPGDIKIESLQGPGLSRVDVALKKTLAKGKSIQESATASSSLEKEAQANASSVTPPEIKGLSNGEDLSTQSDVTIRSVDQTSNVAFVANGNGINQCKKDESKDYNPSDLVPNTNCLSNVINDNNSNEVKNTSDPVVKSPISNGIFNSSVDSCSKDGIPPKDCDEKISKTSNPSSLIEAPVHVQVGSFSKVSTDVESNEKIEPSLESTIIMPVHPKAFSHKNKKKLKKRLPKRQIGTTRLSSGFILGTAFIYRKKMKRKSKKRSALKIDTLSQENLGPSTSEVTRPLPIAVKTRKKSSKLSSSKKENISTAKINGLTEGVNDEKLRERVGQNDAAVVIDTPPQCISSSALDRNGSVGKGHMQNGLMNMLTRGLEETMVARWDEADQPSSQIMGRNIEKPVSIGYIGDEWDEEYDQGKRKKLKNTITDFGGPNPFQVFATQKTKFKKAKFDRSRSANQPYRI